MQKSRRAIVLICLCLIVLLSLGLTGCEDPDRDVTAAGELSREQVIEIRDAYFDQIYGGELFAAWKYDKSDISISDYGTYDGNIVVGISDYADKDAGYDCAIWDMVIDEIYITSYGKPFALWVYLNPAANKEKKALLRLEDAYEKGYIDRDELGEIALHVREGYERSYLESGYDAGESYPPGMTAEEEKEVRLAYLQAFYPEAAEERVVHIFLVRQLYTCADGSRVFYLYEDRIGLRLGVAAKGEGSLTVGGREICTFPNEQYKIFVYTPDGECLTLQDAYGLHVTEGDLGEISAKARECGEYYLPF